LMCAGIGGCGELRLGAGGGSLLDGVPSSLPAHAGTEEHAPLRGGGSRLIVVNANLSSSARAWPRETSRSGSTQLGSCGVSPRPGKIP
jgi:hypothetical protein